MGIIFTVASEKLRNRERKKAKPRSVSEGGTAVSPPAVQPQAGDRNAMKKAMAEAAPMTGKKVSW